MPGVLVEPDAPPPYWCEPRPDLTEDSRRWQALLMAAFLADGELADELFDVLHGLRCAGARIDDTATGWRLVPGTEYFGDWATDRQEWLLPQRAAITRLLRAAAQPRKD